MGPAMTDRDFPSETNIADGYEARAAALRQAAAALRNPEDRAELETIAAGYEADAARLRRKAALSRSSARRP